MSSELAPVGRRSPAGSTRGELSGGERASGALIALAGNPNTGKSSVFNRLTGLDQKVGNYPGITVDRHEGRLDLGEGRHARLIDVPGTYSLSARSAEEQIAIQCIAGIEPMEPPDVVVLVVDVTQLSRNLYLALQVVELGTPVVLALTMVDLLEKAGKRLDVEALSRAMGVPVVAVSGLDTFGVESLRRTIAAVVGGEIAPPDAPAWREGLEGLAEDLRAVSPELPGSWTRGDERRTEALALWSLLSIEEQDELADIPAGLRRVVEERRRVASESGRSIESEAIEGRYSWIDDHCSGLIRSAGPAAKSGTERIDSLLLHPALGFVLFLAVMGVLFQSLFSLGRPGMIGVDRGRLRVDRWRRPSRVHLARQPACGTSLIEGLIGGRGQRPRVPALRS